MPAGRKITTFLWFDNNAEEAMNHYVSIFRNSKIFDIAAPQHADFAGCAAGLQQACAAELPIASGRLSRRDARPRHSCALHHTHSARAAPI